MSALESYEVSLLIATLTIHVQPLTLQMVALSLHWRAPTPVPTGRMASPLPSRSPVPWGWRMAGSQCEPLSAPRVPLRLRPWRPSSRSGGRSG